MCLISDGEAAVRLRLQIRAVQAEVKTLVDFFLQQ
jgi:hypothetical protein